MDGIRSPIGKTLVPINGALRQLNAVFRAFDDAQLGNGTVRPKKRLFRKMTEMTQNGPFWLAARCSGRFAQFWAEKRAAPKISVFWVKKRVSCESGFFGPKKWSPN